MQRYSVDTISIALQNTLGFTYIMAELDDLMRALQLEQNMITSSYVASLQIYMRHLSLFQIFAFKLNL
jgi:hypothetical protein